MPNLSMASYFQPSALCSSKDNANTAKSVDTVWHFLKICATSGICWAADLIDVKSSPPCVDKVVGDKLVQSVNILLVANIRVVVVGRRVAFHVGIISLEPIDVGEVLYPVAAR